MRKFPIFLRQTFQLHFPIRSRTSCKQPSLTFSFQASRWENPRAGVVGGPGSPAPALSPRRQTAAPRSFPQQRPRLSKRVSGRGPVPSLTSEGRLVSPGRGQLQVAGHQQGSFHSPAKVAFPGLCHRLMRAPQRRRGLNRPMSAERRGGARTRGGAAPESVELAAGEKFQNRTMLFQLDG